MWTLSTSSLAEADIAEAALWYEDQRPGLGREFVAQVDAVLRLIRQDPTRLRVHYPPEEVRRVLIKRFPYHVYYYLQGQTVRIFAVVHASRHESAWKRQL